MLWCSRCGRVLAELSGRFSELMQQFEGTACSGCGMVLCDSCNPAPSQGGSLTCTNCAGSLEPAFARDVEAIHHKHRKAIDAWCDRFSAQAIRVHIGNRSAMTGDSVREEGPGGPLFFDLIADGPLRGIEEAGDRPGMLGFEFDSHLKASSEYDHFTLGYEVSGVEDDGERLVIHKGGQVLRLVAHAPSPAASPVLGPGPGVASGEPPAGYTLERHAACGGVGCEHCNGQGGFFVEAPARVCAACRGRCYTIVDELFIGPMCSACEGTGWSGGIRKVAASAATATAATATAATATAVTATAAPPEEAPTAPPDGILAGHTESVQACAVSPDGAWIVSGAGGYPTSGALKVWQAANGSCLMTIPGQTTPGSNPLVAGPDGTWFVSAGGSARDDVFVLRIWDVATGSCRRTLSGHTHWVTDCAVGPDGTWLVSASDDGSLRIWDVATGACRRVLAGHEGSVNTCAVSPDGTWVVSTGGDGTLRVWDVTTGACLHTLRGHDGGVHAVAVGPDGSWLVSAGDETLRVWDVATGACRHVLEGHTDAVFFVSVSPDGTWIVSGSSPVRRGADLDLRVWDPATGACRHVLRGHTDWVTDVAVSPDGQWIVSASRDRTLRIWDPGTGACVRSLVGHDDGVVCLAVSPDSAWIVAGGYDQTLRIWDMAPGRRTLPSVARGAVEPVQPAPTHVSSAVEPVQPGNPVIAAPAGRGGVRGLFARLRHADTASSKESQGVTLVRTYSETKTEPVTGVTGVLHYEVYRAQTEGDARAFLKGREAPERLHYLVVETPEGTWGRDSNGIYRE